MVNHVIALDNVCKEYYLADGTAMPVLKSIDLMIEPGEFVSIMGPSGSGKSTLMNILGTLDRTTHGIYYLDGEDTSECDDAKLAHVRNHTLGFVFQGFNLLPRRTIIDNIALPLTYGEESYAERLKRAEYYLEQVGLASHRNYYPNQLSGGQQQRIAIARALISEPKVILADEPTGNLDSNTSDEIMKLFTKLNEEGVTIVLITHEQDIARYGKRLVHLKDGEVIYDGPMY